jgi:hypothetical protein
MLKIQRTRKERNSGELTVQVKQRGYTSGRHEKIRMLKELGKKLLYDELTVYALRISSEPVYKLYVRNGVLHLVYKFKGDAAWEEAEAFVKQVKKKGVKARIDRDTSETDKVFVVVKTDLDEELEVYEKQLEL